MSLLSGILQDIQTSGASAVAPPEGIARKAYPLSAPTKRKAEDELTKAENGSTKINRTDSVKVAERPRQSLPQVKSNGVATPPAPAAVSSTKNPKKGSFAAIMAKAKEAPPVAASSLGSITHKPKEKRSRKELLAERELAKQAAKKGVSVKSLNGKSTASKGPSTKIEPVKPPAAASKNGYSGTLKPTEKPGYKGTLKPTGPPKYSGTLKPVQSNTSRLGGRDSTSARPPAYGQRRQEYDDESDQYESDNVSEDYSDMDAGFDDVEEEEELAARTARKEDAALQAELDRLKREKDRKKALLAKGR